MHASISKKSRFVTIRQLSIPGKVGASFWWWIPSTPTSQLGLGKRHWNLETSSAVVVPPPYLNRLQIIYFFIKPASVIFTQISSKSIGTGQFQHHFVASLSLPMWSCNGCS